MSARTIRNAAERLAFGHVRRADGRYEPEAVVRFWFGVIPRQRFGLRDAVTLPTRIPCWAGHWSRRFMDVDGLIRHRFEETHGLAVDGELDHWAETAIGRLAFVILLDQMSRNMYRGTSAAFAQDQRVLPVVERALSQGDDQALNPLARLVFYVPLMRHEDLEILDRCVTLYERAVANARGIPLLVARTELASARRHREIVQRFGRYPHRNVALGRETTPEEAVFLRTAFSSF